MVDQASRSPASFQQSDDDIDLMQLVGVIWDGKWIIALFTFLAVLLAAAFAILSTPEYKANALVQVESKKASLPGLDSLGNMFTSESEAQTEIEILRSRFVLNKVVDLLNLDIQIQPSTFPVLGNFFYRTFQSSAELAFRSPLWGGNYAWGGESAQVSLLEVPKRYVDQGLTLIAGESGQFSLWDSNATLLLEGQVGNLVYQDEWAIKVESLQARPGTSFQMNKVSRYNALAAVQQRLGVSERGKGSGILELTMQGDDPEHIQHILDAIADVYYAQNVQRLSAEAEKSLAFLGTKLPELKVELEAAEQRLNDYRLSSESVNLELETKAVLDQLVGLEEKLNELSLKEAELQKRYTRQHPAYAALLEQKNRLQKEKKQLAEKVQSLPETQQEVLRLTRDVEVGNQIYLQLLGKSQELDILKASTVGTVRVLDQAMVDPKPVKPKKALIVAVGMLLGLVLGMGLVLLRAALRRGVEDPEQLEQATGLPVYATVPFSAEQQKLDVDFKKGKRKSGLLALENPAALSIESLRALRTSLHFAMLEAKNNIIAISGPSPDIGKSFVSSNLGAVIASAGQRVLVVDADMRKGHLQRFFGVERAPGLSDYLGGTKSWREVIHHTAQPDLHFIATGTLPPNPSELLMSAAMERFLAEAAAEYDLVLVDTPPIMAVTDAAIIGRQVGATLMVVRFGMNPLREVTAAHRRFEQNGIQVKGCIMNGMVQKRGSKYGYGYGYGYYNYEYKSEAKS